VQGERQTIDGVYPTYHQEHETVELPEGLNGWSEVGFYVFTSEQNGRGVQWVGDHIRPRVRVPDSWGWRPIVDKSIGRWYFAEAYLPRRFLTILGLNVCRG